MTSIARSTVRIVVFVVVVVMVAIVVRMAGNRQRSAAAPLAIAADHWADRPRAPASRAIAPVRPVAATDSVEICGKGRVAIDKADPGVAFHYVGKLAAAAEARWLTALQNSDDLRARVAGLYFEGKLTGGRSLRPVTEQTRNEVVQLAAGSSDPAVYAMALSMCQAVSHDDADINPLERAYLATEVIGIEAGIGLPEYNIASHHCSVAGTQAGETRQTCAALAELLVTRGTNLLDMAMGVAIGKRAGWPSERVNQVTLEQHALMQALMQQVPADEDNMWSCDAVTRSNAYMGETVRVGELAAARALLERSGETPEIMADKFVRYMDRIKQ